MVSFSSSRMTLPSPAFDDEMATTFVVKVMRNRRSKASCSTAMRRALPSCFRKSIANGGGDIGIGRSRVDVNAPPRR